MKKPVEPEIIVSDHAVARYMERVLGYPIAALRKQIADDCRASIALGARALRKDGFTYHFQHHTVATVTQDSPLPSHSVTNGWKRPPKVAG